MLFSAILCTPPRAQYRTIPVAIGGNQIKSDKIRRNRTKPDKIGQHRTTSDTIRQIQMKSGEICQNWTIHCNNHKINTTYILKNIPGRRPHERTRGDEGPHTTLVVDI